MVAGVNDKNQGERILLIMRMDAHNGHCPTPPIDHTAALRGSPAHRAENVMPEVI
jgi:hypothetical protein